MIIEYHRPESLEEALKLLSRNEPLTVPLAGGTALNRPTTQSLAVVDLQSLGLATLRKQGNLLQIGAMLSLQSWLDDLQMGEGYNSQLRSALLRTIEHEATHNLRQAATVAGTLIAADGRSPLATVMLALDAHLQIQPGDMTIKLGDLLPFRSERLKGKLITQFSLTMNAGLAYEYVARSPADLPIVAVAVAHWSSTSTLGRTRLTLGGYGEVPRLAFDGNEPGGVENAAANSFSQAEDAWASAEYRQAVAGVLTRRCLADLMN